MIPQWEWTLTISSWQTQEPALILRFPIQTVITHLHIEPKELSLWWNTACHETSRKLWYGFCRYGRLLSFAVKLCRTSYLMHLKSCMASSDKQMSVSEERVSVSLCCDISATLDMSCWTQKDDRTLGSHFEFGWALGQSCHLLKVKVRKRLLDTKSEFVLLNFQLSWLYLNKTNLEDLQFVQFKELLKSQLVGNNVGIVCFWKEIRSMLKVLYSDNANYVVN